MRKPTVPQEYHSMIYDMWREGVTRREIGEQFKVHQNVIWHIVKKQNGGTASQRGQNVLPTKHELHEMYILEDRSQQDIADICEINLGAVKRLLKEYGILKRPHQYKTAQRPDDDDLYTDYILEDMTQQELAVKYEVSPSKIQSWLRTAELSKR